MAKNLSIIFKSLKLLKYGLFIKPVGFVLRTPFSFLKPGNPVLFLSFFLSLSRRFFWKKLISFVLRHAHSELGTGFFLPLLLLNSSLGTSGRRKRFGREEEEEIGSGI